MNDIKAVSGGIADTPDEAQNRLLKEGIPQLIGAFDEEFVVRVFEAHEVHNSDPRKFVALAIAFPSRRSS